MRLLHEHRYTLIIDEALECIEQYQMSQHDLGKLTKQGFISKGTGGRAVWTEPENSYNGRFQDVKQLCLNGNLVMPTDKMLMWELPIEFLRQFEAVYILTYLFEGSPMSLYLRANGMPYEVFSINRAGSLVPAAHRDDEAYKARLRQLIHVIDDPRLNYVGESSG